MFWGLIMEPNKRYTQTVERPFHVSMATLDISTADDTAVQVMLCFENRNYLLCNLNKDQTSQVPLDLNFQEGTKIAFTSNGRGHVHLTGYLIPEDDELDMDDLEDEDEMEEEEEVPQLVGKATKRKAESLLDAKTLKKLKTLGKMVSEEGEDSSDDDDDDEEDDDEAQLGEDSDDDLEEEEEDDEEEDDEDDDEEEEEEEEEEAPVEQKPKGKQNQKQQKNNKQEAKAAVNGKDGNQQKKNKKEQQPQQQNKKEAQNNKEQQQPEKQQNKKDKQNEQQQVQKKRVLSGGVQIEELTVGNGQPAKNGKFVSVYYVGKLKNGKKFDATQKGEGFKFRLGAGEVIKGWDIGVAGMKVGGKRRITVPAAMGYGQKGSPPVIPPNSLLVFDVELKKVN